MRFSSLVGLFPLVTATMTMTLGAACTGGGARDDVTAAGAAVSDLTLADWVKAKATDVPPLGLSPNDARMKKAFAGFIRDDMDIVGVGENAHGTHEYNQLRAKLFQYLVENHGFRVIVPETGLVEAALVDAYVQGSTGVTLDDVLARGFTHSMGLAQESKDLIEWMRAYNEGKSPAERIHFAGKDLSILGDTLTAPLEPLAAYLTKVDPSYASSTAFKETMGLARKASTVTIQVDAAYRAKGANGIDPDILDCFTTISFEQLGAAEQQDLETGVAKLATDVAGKASAYTAASTDDDYQWNTQLAVVATQLIKDLRSRQKHPKIMGYEKAVALLAQSAPNVVVDAGPASDPKSHNVDYKSEAHLTDYFLGRDAREEALAANVAWGQKRYGKMMNFAHFGHLNKLPKGKITVGGVDVQNSGLSEGTFLTKAYGKRYAVIGSTAIDYNDESGKPDPHFQLVTTSPESIEYEIMSIARDHEVGLFVDLTRGSLPAGLNGKRKLRFNVDFQDADIRGNFDGLIVFSSVGPGHAIAQKQP